MGHLVEHFSISLGFLFQKYTMATKTEFGERNMRALILGFFKPFVQ